MERTPPGDCSLGMDGEFDPEGRSSTASFKTLPGATYHAKYS